MMKFMKIFKIMPIIILATIVLSACGAAAPAEPTQDPNAIFTQVAETVMVSMTQTSEAMPPTPMPEPTATTAPTLPPAPTVDLAAQPTVVPLPVGPTATIQRFGDSAKFNTQTPGDGKVFKASETFNFVVCLGNDGSTIWDTTYYLDWVSGYRLWNNTKNFFVEEDIDPGEKWCFYLPSVAPPDPGSYTTRWYFKNGDNESLLEVYFNYRVES
jgi:hypothetical protein